MKYLTIDTPGQSVIREKMSRFIAVAFHVDSAAEAKAAIDKLRNEYHDARHVCWAYMIGAARTEHLSSDNGEPSGTAGKPILGQIVSAGITDVAVVVVRYFGGIKLGTSGLIVAYRTAAREAIEAAAIVEQEEQAVVTFAYPYASMNEAMKLAKSPGVKVLGQEMDMECQLTLRIALDDQDMTLQRIANIPGARVIEDDGARGEGENQQS